MKVMAYLFGAFVALAAGVFLYGLSGSVRVGVVGSAAVLIVCVLVIRGWERIGYEAEEPGSEDANARSAAMYSSAGSGGAYFGGSDGGGGFGGGCDGGGGGSC